MLVFVLVLLVSNNAAAEDLSNSLNLIFVADKTSHLIDVVDTSIAKVVYRIRTPFVVDALVATPYAPLLFFADIETRTLVSYNLREKHIGSQIELPITPRHMVIDPAGKYLGITDSEAGGLVIFSTYAGEILYTDTAFPSTKDLLFDADETSIYYTNDRAGSLGVLDLTLQSTVEVDLLEGAEGTLSAPSRSLDGRYIYVADSQTGDIFSLNAYSGVIYKTYNTGSSPVRPYTTPEGAYLYILDAETGRFTSVEQMGFTTQADVELSPGLDLFAVGRFDRFTLILGSATTTYHLYDNLRGKPISQGSFTSTPLDAAGSVDGKAAWIAFSAVPLVAMFDFDTTEVTYVAATDNGVGAFAAGGTNNVCH